MKKLIFTAAIALSSLATFATTTTSIVNNTTEVSVQEKFTEVSLDALPDAVKATAKNSFPNSKLVKAFTNDKKEYKLQIAVGDTNHEILTDASGNIIKK